MGSRADIGRLKKHSKLGYKTAYTDTVIRDSDTQNRKMTSDGHQTTAVKVQTDDEAQIAVKRTTQKTIIHNLVVVCISFFMSFTAFSGLANLQSSMNFKGSVGHTALTIVFLSPIVSNLLFSASVIRKLGPKLSMAISMLAATAFPIVSFYSSAEALYSGAAIAGLTGGILWSAHGTYVTALGRSYAAVGGHTPQSIIGLFFGTFFMSHRLAMVAGSLVSSLVFQKPDDTNHLPPDVVSRICGSAYCYEDLDASDHWLNKSDSLMEHFNDTSTSLIYRPSLLQMYSLYGIYVVCAGSAPVLLLKFLRTIDATPESAKQRKVHIWSNLCATLQHLVHVNILLLMPIMFLNGASFAFMIADFGVGFTSCTLGIDSVGYVIATFGATSALTSVSSGLLLKYTGRQTLFFFGAACCLATLIGMWKWISRSDEPEILYLFAGLWGVSTTVWTSQLISFVGSLYDEESAPMAFACYHTILAASTGFWFIIGRNLCVHSQLHLLMLSLAIGMVGYMIVELLVRKEEQKIMKASTTDTSDVTRY